MGGVFHSCCRDSNVDFAKKRVYKDAPESRISPQGQSQVRANLAVKKGGFSIGAFAASNRGKVEDFYDVEEKIMGEGSYGSVRRCLFRDTGQWRACKTISKELVRSADRFKEEMAIMRLLDHPNIVRLHETFDDATNVYLVLELCSGGELFDKIVAEGKFSERAAAICVQQMLRAVNYMHQNYIMHRDLKPENWLLATPGQAIEHSDLKLIDFGLSKRFIPGELATTRAGTPYYIAPEVLEGRYAELSDMWSIGVIMYILLSGSPPFTGSNTQAVLDNVIAAKPTFDGKFWKRVSMEAKQMLRSLLQRDPAIRLNASSALQDKWLEKVSNWVVTEDPAAGAGIVSKLRCFSAMNKLKKASLNVIATQINGNGLKELKDIFMAMDGNNDGTLSIVELKNGLRKAGVAIPLDFEQLLNSIDTDGSGVIDYSEFMAATIDKCRYVEEDVCWRAFKTFDMDGNGIDKARLLSLLGVDAITNMMDRKVTEKEVDSIMKEVDLNCDGNIDFKEFLLMMRRMPRKGGRFLTQAQPALNIGIGNMAEVPQAQSEDSMARPGQSQP